MHTNMPRLPNEELHREIDRAIVAYEQAIQHYASRTRQLIDSYGYEGALSRLVVSADLQQGFRVLRDLGQLDLTFESIVTRYPSHFPRDAVEAAQWRITNADTLL